MRWRRRALDHHSALATLRLELSLPSQQNDELRDAVVIGQQTLRVVLADYLIQVAGELRATLRIDAETLATAILGSFDGTAISGGVEPPSPHNEAFAFSLAAMLLSSFDPPPVSWKKWPDLLEHLLAEERRRPR